MKKSLLFAGAIFLTSSIAFAKTINFDTPIKWNTSVIENALSKVGMGSFAGNQDFIPARLTHNRILSELLKKESFSIREATRICLDKCNMLSSDLRKDAFLFEDCAELCEMFGKKLVDENNAFSENPTPDPNTNILNLINYNDRVVKIFTEDKKYYVLWDHKANITGGGELDREIRIYTGYVCDYSSGSGLRPTGVLFLTESDTPIALIRGEYGADQEEFIIHTTCHIDSTPRKMNVQIYGRKRSPTSDFNEVPGIMVNENIKIQSMSVYPASNPEYQHYTRTL